MNNEENTIQPTTPGASAGQPTPHSQAGVSPSQSVNSEPQSSNGGTSVQAGTSVQPDLTNGPDGQQAPTSAASASAEPPQTPKAASVSTGPAPATPESMQTPNAGTSNEDRSAPSRTSSQTASASGNGNGMTSDIPAGVAATPPSSPEGNRGGKPTSYLVEYILSLIMVGTLLGLAITFFGNILDSIGGDSASSGWAARWAFTTSLTQLSTAIVFVVGFWWLARRSYRVEDNAPEVKQHRWRKGFLGLFLVLVGLAALSAAVALVYHVLSLLASIGVTDIEGWEATKNILISLFSTVLLAATAMLYTQDYRGANMNPLMHKLHHYGLMLGVIILAVLFAVFPLRAERNSFIDAVASDDIETLNELVDDYSRDEGELPKKLSDVDMEEELESRLDNYEYKPDGRSYELCADFRTDTTDEDANGNPLEDAFGTSGLTRTRDNDPYHHESGEQCFEYDATGVRFGGGGLFDTNNGSGNFGEDTGSPGEGSRFEDPDTMREL